MTNWTSPLQGGLGLVSCSDVSQTSDESVGMRSRRTIAPWVDSAAGWPS